MGRVITERFNCTGLTRRGKSGRMRMLPLKTVTMAVLVIAAACAVRTNAAVPEYTASIVNRYPHDPGAFTEGLLYHEGFLYESTGRNGQSSIRKVVLETGAVIRQRNIDAKYFGEGIAIWQDSLIELTWKNQLGFVYDLNTFKPRASF